MGVDLHKHSAGSLGALLRILLGDSFEGDELLGAVGIELEDGGGISGAVDVVGRREESEDFVVVSPLEAVHDELMSSDDVVETIVVAEVLGDVSAPEVTGTSVGADETSSVDGIGPKKVGHGSIAGRLRETVQSRDLIDRLHVGRQSSMHAEDAVVDESREREEIENLVQHLPHTRVAIISVALGPKTIQLIDRTRLVVTAQHRHPVRVQRLVAQQQLHHLDTIRSSIHKISQKQILRLRQSSSCTHTRGKGEMKKKGIRAVSHRNREIACFN